MNPFVVAGLLVRRDGVLRVLVSKRSETRLAYPNVWDVRGGHGQLDLPAQGHEQAMPLLVYEVTAWTGAPFNLQPEEHAEIGWFTIDEACRLGLAHPAYVELFGGLAPAASELP
jgi:8-oxo-dGTP diphosphatase